MPSTKARRPAKGLKTLSIDVGGTRLKAALLDENGKMITERVRTDTPKPCPPEVLIPALKQLVAQLPAYDRISVGFPGVVRHGKVYSAVNLGRESWHGFDLDKALTKQFGKPTRVINDADMQGLDAIKAKGVEMVITLGTGVGSGLFEDGKLAPHLEIGHIPFRNGETFEEQLGNRAFMEVGDRRWNRRLQRAIKCWRTLTSFDKLYLGGGNAEHVNFKLDPDVEIVSNELGMIGGIWLWRERGEKGKG